MSGARHLRFGLAGLALGFGLSRIGFSDFGEVHKLFTFADLRLLWTFAAAVGLCFAGYAALSKWGTAPARALHTGSVAGGLLFGVGWAITGACPGVVLVQLGEGKWPAIVTAAGIVAGTWLYPLVHRRWFRWDLKACEI
jgi:uncharacterized membrane protein YedE/YeeE